MQTGGKPAFGKKRVLPGDAPRGKIKLTQDGEAADADFVPKVGLRPVTLEHFLIKSFLCEPDTRLTDVTGMEHRRLPARGALRAQHFLEAMWIGDAMIFGKQEERRSSRFRPWVIALKAIVRLAMDQTIGVAQVESDLVVKSARLSVGDDDHLERVGRTGLLASPALNVSRIAARIAERQSARKAAQHRLWRWRPVPTSGMVH